METIVSQLDKAFRSAIRAAFDLEADPLIGASQNEKFGDYQSNAAMGLAKQVAAKTGRKTNPRAVAEAVKAKLDLGDMAEEVSIAGPGFINVRLRPAWMGRRLATVLDGKDDALPKTPAPKKVVVDYSGPNIAKEMHVGHLRSTIIGDAIGRLMEACGHEVIRQNHVGDWGTQFGMLIQYMVETDQKLGVLSDLEGFYRAAKERFDADPAFAEQARATVVSLQEESEPILSLWQVIVEETRRHYQPIYQRLGVKLGVADERGESFYNAMLSGIVEELLEKKVAVLSEGAVVVFVPGFETPLIIQKSDGGYLYGTTDLAAVKYRTQELKADWVIYTHDSRQAQHFAQVFWAARQAGWAEGVTLDYAPFGTMLGEDGKPFKTRTGGAAKLKELLDEAEERAFAVVTQKNPDLPEAERNAIARAVGTGAVKYADLSKDRVSDYVFSFDKMLSLEGNTAPYLQYAYARIRSIFRRGEERGVLYAGPAELRLESPYEVALARHLLRLGEVVELSVRELKPHYLCTYLYELATRFSAFFENCPVLQSEDPTRASRLALCDAVGRGMASGLDLLGIPHPDRM